MHRFARAARRGRFSRLPESHPRRRAVAAGLLLLGLLALRGPTAAAPLVPAEPGLTEGGWTNLFPELNAVSAVSPTDVWAGGEYGHLLHYDGAAWTALDPPALHGATIRAIAMQSATQGWIAAGTGVFEYDGTGWAEHSTGLSLTVGRLAVVGSDDVWAAGYNDYAGGDPTLLHWDGSRWQPAGPDTAGTAWLSDVAMSGSATGWTVGYAVADGTRQAVLYRYDGGAWVQVTPPADAGFFYHVATLGADDAWITGIDTAGRGAVYHYAAGMWSAWPTPEGSDPLDVLPMSATSVWASTGSGAILHWDGQQWSTAYTGRLTPGLSTAGGRIWAVGLAGTVLAHDPAGPWQVLRGGPTTFNLNDVSVLTADDAWAVGEPGTFVHFSGGNWALVPGQNPATLVRLRMLSDSDGYGVGPHVIAHWDGTTWTQVATPTVSLLGLAMTGLGEGWAVGEGGAIWRDHAGTWAAVSSPTTADLYGVAFDSADHGWAVGGYIAGGGISFPTILECRAGQWRDVAPDLEGEVLEDLALEPGGTEGWAVGDLIGSGSPVLHLLDGTWSRGDAPTPFLWRAAAEALDETWAISGSIYYNAAYHQVHGAWATQPLPIGSNYGTTLLGLDLLPGRGGWAVGAGGKILRYNPLAPGQRFYDVPPAHPFYSYIDYMAAHNIVGGYADNTFHPAADVTRGQLTKMVANGMGWPLVTPAAPTFADVPAADPFYAFVETAAAHGVISGYSCGGPGEPCDGQRRPYFRPVANVTRGQLAKIVVGAKGWGPAAPPTPTFADVPASQPFYGWVEQAVAHGILSGYTCGGPGEPCPGSYFRPGAPATRAQMSKILALALQAP